MWLQRLFPPIAYPHLSSAARRSPHPPPRPLYFFTGGAHFGYLSKLVARYDANGWAVGSELRWVACGADGEVQWGSGISCYSDLPCQNLCPAQLCTNLLLVRQTDRQTMWPCIPPISTHVGTPLPVSLCSIADLLLFDIVDLHTRVYDEQFRAAYPDLAAHHDK